MPLVAQQTVHDLINQLTTMHTVLARSPSRRRPSFSMTRIDAALRASAAARTRLKSG
jgi:hypothetical protein